MMNNFLSIRNYIYDLVETVSYPNGGHSYFYVNNDCAIIIDDGICNIEKNTDAFQYSLITDKQNQYINTYTQVYRFLAEDINTIEDTIYYDTSNNVDYGITVGDRSGGVNSSPLELLFEKNFSNVYGSNALKYLHKEYDIVDRFGKNHFLDYLVHTKFGDIAVEENGINYHHPQIIGFEKYRKQLLKQNTCTTWGIKLFRFSTDDCMFEERIEDDIKSFFGDDTEQFVDYGILAKRPVKLYEHQIFTLEDIKRQRDEGLSTFLVVYPTASGKSKIVEEDIIEYSFGKPRLKVLVMAPNTNIVDDWNRRVEIFPNNVDVTVTTFAAMMNRYMQYVQDAFDYIVIDEAHHAVSPVLRRVIQHFTPQFLIGLTATDQRPDKKRLEDIFGNYRTGLSLGEAMEKKIIAEANVYRIETNIDLSEVRFNGKDYINADLERSIRVTSRNNLIAEVLKEYFCDGGLEQKQGLIFCANIGHTIEMERVLNECGISAKAYTAKTKSPDAVMKSFKQKDIRFLCTCSMISEGWDYPELGIVVMARPTLSKVLYLQQIGRGLRRTDTKENVFIIDVVDEYGAMAKPCSMHSIFSNSMYVPFGSIINRNYSIGDFIEVDGLHERVESIVEIDINTFEDKYGNYLNQEQLAREFFMSTGSIVSWIKRGRIVPDNVIKFGNRSVYLFSPENVEAIRKNNNITIHDDSTIRQDFFDFLEERDYSLSYKMPFLLGLLKNVNSIGEAKIDDVLDYYISFYKNRIDQGLKVDRDTCPYSLKTLEDKAYIKSSMLTNPFEKFERKRFMYYSKDLSMISFNHALVSALTESDYKAIEKQMLDDLENYYSKI